MTMSDTADHDLVLDLARVLEEYTHHHTALLDSVRTFRAEFLGPAWTVDESRRPPAPRFLTPPPPPRTRPVAVPAPQSFEAPPPPPRTRPVAVPAPHSYEAPPPPPWTRPVAVPAIIPATPPRATKRDYDYFAELDERLAHLRAEIGSEEFDEADGWSA